MKKIIFIIVFLLFSQISFAKIGLNLSLVYKKGIGKGFFLSTEQHSIEQVDENELVAISMKNGIKAEVSSFFVDSKEYGPSGFVRIKGAIYDQSGKMVKTLNKPVFDIYLGESKSVVHEVRGEEQIELTIKPVSY